MIARDKFFKFLLTLSAVYALLTVLSFFSDHLQRRYLHDLPYWQWSILQQSPAMYNLQNVVEVHYSNGSRDVRYYNHHPMRLIYENKFDFRDAKVERIKVLTIKEADSLWSAFTLVSAEDDFQLKEIN